MKFRTIILLTIWSVVLCVLVVGFFLVNYWIRSQVAAQTNQDLRTHYRTLQALNDLRLEELAKSCELFAETPRLKAVVELGDRNTIRQLALELQQSINGDILGVAGKRGELLLVLLYGQIIATPSFPGGFGNYGTDPRIMTDVVAIETKPYRIASAPIRVGADVIGRLVVGFHVTRDELFDLREMIESDMVLLAGNTPAGTTLKEEDLRKITGWLSDHSAVLKQAGGSMDNLLEMQMPDELFKVAAVPLGRSRQIEGDRSVCLLVLKPIERETQLAIHPVVNAFLVLSAIVLLIAIVVGFLVSQGVTRPVADLVRGTAEISRGNYDYKIDISGGVELKLLSERFGEMSRSLKEKVQQLDLRNQKLEVTIRQLRETQEELVRSERLVAMGKLTTQLSHEINNPVHNILSSLQTALKKTPSDSPARELMEVAHEEVERLARLTKQLLNVYRASSTAPEPGVAVQLNDVIREVVAVSNESLRQDRIDISLTLDENLPRILGTADKLKQVFLNLIVNARDAMDGGGTLSIVTRKANGHAEVTVTDTGIGIPAENINRVFDAFFTTKGEVSGVGLGLSVSYGIVQQHRGTIMVRSRPGKGASFTLSFPEFNTDKEKSV